MRLLFVILSFVLLCASPVAAQSNNSLAFVLTFPEPTTNTDSSALEDLSHHELGIDFYVDGAEELIIEIPASGANGGETIEYQYIYTLPSGRNRADVTRMKARARSVDSNGNASPWRDASEHTVVWEDITTDNVAPAAPNSLTIEHIGVATVSP